jgi:hypothetical protein
MPTVSEKIRTFQEAVKSWFAEAEASRMVRGKGRSMLAVEGRTSGRRLIDDPASSGSGEPT